MAKVKTVMVAMTGMSPAVITETIWALYKEKPDWVPDQVLVYTTQKGQKVFYEQVRRCESGKKSIWEQLTAKVGKPEMKIHTVLFQDDKDNALEDITTNEQQMLVADQLLTAIRNLKNPCADPCRIVASIAGGRKSMSALMYAAMTYGADEEDIITHVLADENASNCRTFFFPEQKEQKLKNGKDQQDFTAKKVHLELAEIPFAPLRSLVGSAVEDANGSFATLVGRARKRLRYINVEDTRIRLSHSECVATINGKPISLPEEQYALLAILVVFRRKEQGAVGKRMGIEDLAEGGRILEELKNQKALPGTVLERWSFLFYGEWKAGAAWPDDIKRQKSYLKKSLTDAGFAHVCEDVFAHGKMGFVNISDVAFKGE